MIGLIPARGGSKGIPGKNLALCGGRPLLAWTAEAAIELKVLDRVILSTDDEKIAAAGRTLELDVPFLRPAELSNDTATMHSVIAHTLSYLRSGEHDVEGIVLLQPTSPTRRAHHIAEAVTLFRNTAAATVVSVVRVPHRYVPSSVMREEDGRLVPYEGNGIGPTQRQQKATLFARNGPAVLIIRPQVVDAGRLYGEPTVGYEMTEMESLDIDTPDDLRLADLVIKNWSV